ncbi:hypothetical protein IAT38_002800 [Cryptococcus sp. DSM 104549]
MGNCLSSKSTPTDTPTAQATFYPTLRTNTNTNLVSKHKTRPSVASIGTGEGRPEISGPMEVQGAGAEGVNWGYKGLNQGMSEKR